MGMHNMTSILGTPLGFGARCRCIAAACALFAAQMAAADASGPGQPGTKSTDTELDEIVVSAQRREEKLDKVPISVTAVSY